MAHNDCKLFAEPYQLFFYPFKHVFIKGYHCRESLQDKNKYPVNRLYKTLDRLKSLANGNSVETLQLIQSSVMKL